LCHHIHQHQKHPPELTIYTTTPTHNNLTLSRAPKIRISDPTRDNYAKSRQRRDKTDSAPVYEGPPRPPELISKNSHRVDCRCPYIITAAITLAGTVLTISLMTTIHSTLTYINQTASLLIHALARILCLAACAILQLIHIILTGIRHCGTHFKQHKVTYSALMITAYLVQEWYYLSVPCRLPLYLQYTACALNLLQGQLVIAIYVLTPLACLYIAAYVTCSTLCSKRHRTLIILISVLACLAACSQPSREATTTNPRLLPLPLLHLIRPTSKPPILTSINPCSTHYRVNIPIPDPRRPISPLSQNTNPRSRAHNYLITALQLSPLLLLQPAQLAIPALALLPLTKTTCSLMALSSPLSNPHGLGTLRRRR
jgi:hypothetical protein